VDNSKDSNNLVSGKTIAKNTVYNLIGYGIPLLFAVVLIPPLINGLGKEKFGILSLSWVVIGYFSFFDFGIARSLTKIISEKIGINKIEDIPEVFWISMFLILGVGILFSVLLFFFSPYFVKNVFNISEGLHKETVKTFYLVAISIPLVTTTAGLRGVLEAYQKFGAINYIRIILGAFTFLGPLLCLIFTNDLFWIVLTLILMRLIVWILYLGQCFKVNNNLKLNIKINFGMIKPILKLSGWMSVSNITAPFILYADRFLIGAIVSAAALTYYVTPYEIISKVLLIPSAIVMVLFPAFSASFINKPEISSKLLLRGVKFIFLFLYPIIFLIITFASEGMNLWLGEIFSNKSTLILQLLAAGVFYNSFAQLTFTYIQGIGRADITAKLNIIEIPIYLLAMWFGITRWGINGAALVWFLRAFIDNILLFLISEKFATRFIDFKIITLFFIMSLLFIVPVMFVNLFAKTVFTVLVLLVLVIISWKFVLLKEEKILFLEKLKLINVRET
jgi:O-antigen/teichoic acid export membrane protein